MRGRLVLGRVMASCALLMAAACVRRPAEGAGDAGGTQRVEGTISITIVNHSQVDAIIYVVHDGVRDRLGAATAAMTTQFTVRTRQLASGIFELLADPVGARRATTSESLLVAQGTSFTWTLETSFERGSVIVRD